MGRSIILVFVCSLTDRTIPSESGFVSRILASGHKDRGEVGSTTNTISPTLRLVFALDHFCLSCISVKYSCVHLLQNKSAKYCTCFHRRLVYESDLENSPGGRTGCEFCKRMWLGVRASRSKGSEDAVVIGRLLRIASTSQNNV